MASGILGKRLLRIAAIGLVAAFCFFFFRNLDWPKLRAAVASAHFSLVFLAAAVNFLHLFVKAVRWGVLLMPVGEVGWLALFRYTLAGYAASNLLPVRVGEVLRVVFLRPHGIQAAGAAGVQVLEKVMEMLSLLLLVAPLPLWLPLPPAAGRTIGLVAFGGVVGILVALLLVRRRGPGQTGWVASLVQGMEILRAPRATAAAFLLSIVVWLIDVTMALLVMAAVGIPPSFAVSVLALLFINVAIAAPSTPAQIGAFEAGGVFALTMVGVSTERALAFALLYHFMQAIPVTLAGLEGLVLWRTMKKKEQATP